MATEVMTRDASAAVGVDPAGLLVDDDAIETRGAEPAATDNCNASCPHTVSDGFLPRRTTEQPLREYPADQGLPICNDAPLREKEGAGCVQKDNRNIRDVLRMPPTYRHLIREPTSPGLLPCLTALSGIPNLTPAGSRWRACTIQHDLWEPPSGWATLP